MQPVPPRARPSRRLRIVLAVSLLAGLSPQLANLARGEVRWRGGERSAPAALSPAEIESGLAALGSRVDRKRIVVHFARPLDGATRAALAGNGLRLLGYLGDHAYFATLAAGLRPREIAALPGLVAVAPIEVRHKLHPDLARGAAPPWSIVSAAGAAAADPLVAVVVLFHPDVELEREAPPAIVRRGGEVRSFVGSVNAVVAHLPLGQVAALAGEDAVAWIEPPLPALVDLNDAVRARVGANVLQEPPWGLDGAGIDVLVYDAGKAFPHADLAGRLTIGASDTAALSDHATHVACTVAGSGSESGGTFVWRGMAPKARVISYGFEQEGGLTQGFLYTDPGDLEADYGEAIAQYGADLSNNSIGTNTAGNGYPCEWEGDYGVTDALIDEIVRGSLGAPFRVIWSNGNERGSGACGSAYHTTAPPACAKNHITVGALNADDDSVTFFTSWGPADDGRLKPDLSAPGCKTAGGVRSCALGGGYSVKCGTSMASPATAGVAALLLQSYRARFPSRPDPRNATLKAILAQTAADVAQPGPDYQSGYGSIRAVAAAELIADERFVEAEIAQGETLAFVTLVAPGDAELKLTLAWDDPAAQPNVVPSLVNDLDLRVIDAAGTIHWPWTLDPQSPAAPALRFQRDGTNNLEQVVIDDPAPGAYRIEIEGRELAAGGTQPFGLALAPALLRCPDLAQVGAVPAAVACSGTITMDVVDCAPNADDTLVEQVDGHVASGSEPAGESVVLSEIAPYAAVFRGVVPVAPTDAPGVIRVADGDTVTLTYVDPDGDGTGAPTAVTAEVAVDCRPPQIDEVSVEPVHAHQATVSVGADEPFRLTLRYGLSCGALTGTATAEQLEPMHAVTLGGLTEQTVYFFRVEAEDGVGNTSVAGGGTACLSFETARVPEVYSEQFLGAFDLTGRSLTFRTDGSPDHYSACAEPLGGALPTDPAGGTDLMLTDDTPVPVALSGGRTLSLYGQSYDTVWVSPNGYLTFGAGDASYEDSFETHFALPRIAALFDDLLPPFGGAVIWQQLDDRIAVTWDDIPQWGGSDDNTFQIEIFFDRRIRLSWLTIAAQDVLVGLSAGAGVPFDFVESDLSAAAACGPHPPAVEDLPAQTHIGKPVTIALAATDDGLPAPPALVYRIVGLPNAGKLIDPATVATIAAPPHDLAGDRVTYLPYAGFGGTDVFRYAADDGGVPPGGGQSQSGTVSVAVTVGPPEVVYAFLTDDADPGWSAGGAWAFGTPQGLGSHGGDPLAGATGANVYGYNLAGDYENGMAPEFLTSQALDLSAVEGAVLEFRRWLGIDRGLFDHAAVQVSTDGAGWATVWNHTGLAIAENAWSLQSHDVSAWADGRPSVRFRWVMGATDATITYPGWNVDDIRVRGVIVPTCSGPPGEVQNLRFLADRRTLRWDALPSGGAAPRYDTLRAGAAFDFSAGSECVESDGTDVETVDPREPSPTEALFYLVRAENACGPGPLGAGGPAGDCPP